MEHVLAMIFGDFCMALILVLRFKDEETFKIKLFYLQNSFLVLISSGQRKKGDYTPIVQVEIQVREVNVIHGFIVTSKLSVCAGEQAFPWTPVASFLRHFRVIKCRQVGGASVALLSRFHHPHSARQSKIRFAASTEVKNSLLWNCKAHGENVKGKELQAC